MKKKALTLLLALMMVLPMFTACSENAADNTAETTAADTAANTTPSADEETVAVEEDEPEILPDIPALDFEGRDFIFLTSGIGDTNGEDWETFDVWVEELNGDVINDAVMERNLFLNETYNIQIGEYKTSGTTLSEIQTEVKVASGAFDAAMTHFENGANLAASGSLHNLYDMPYINLEQPWWDQRGVQDMNLMGGVFLATGDITIVDNDATWVLMFGKQYVEDLQLENPYDLVREDRWTYDKFYEMMSQAAVDMNGDGTLKWQDDKFGFITSDYSSRALMYASGEKLVTQDAQHNLIPIPSIERLSGVVEVAAKMIGDKNITFLTGYESTTPDNIRSVFEEGRALFYGEVMQCIIRMRESETEFGLVPWPKYDQMQDGYYNLVHTSAGRGVCIPVSQTDYEFVGAIVEAFAAKSMYTVTPAYYDVALTYKYMRDTDSAEMLDIILDSRIYDLGLIANYGSMASSIAGIITNGTGNLASTWAKSERAFQKIMDKSVEKYADVMSRTP